MTSYLKKQEPEGNCWILRDASHDGECAKGVLCLFRSAHSFVAGDQTRLREVHFSVLAPRHECSEEALYSALVDPNVQTSAESAIAAGIGHDYFASGEVRNLVSDAMAETPLELVYDAVVPEPESKNEIIQVSAQSIEVKKDTQTVNELTPTAAPKAIDNLVLQMSVSLVGGVIGGALAFLLLRVVL